MCAITSEFLDPSAVNTEYFKPGECNFAAGLARRLGPDSALTDAPSGETLKGSEISKNVICFAAAYISSGLRAGDRILISCGLNVDSALAYLGAIYAGLVPVPIEDRMLSLHGRALLNKTRAKGLWTGTGVKSDWEMPGEVIRLQGRLSNECSDFIEPHLGSLDGLAALMPTSGSTGIPRLVMVSHRNLISNTEAIVRSQNLGTDERAMLVMPVSYCFGASIMHSHFYQGGSVVFDSRFMFPDKVLRAINQYSCTSFAGVPTAYNMLLRRSSIRTIAMPTLRRFLQAGGGLAPQSVQEMKQVVPGAAFYVMYGQTEATARIACLPPERLKDKLGSAGLPLDNLVVQIRDDNGHEVPVGQPGEIWVQGPSICQGYLEDPEESSRKFVDGWLRTEDMASLDDEGYLWIKGRKGDFLKIRGVRISYSEVEAKVGSIPGVFECAAGSVSHAEAGEALALFIVPEPGVEDVCERVRRSLPPHWTCESVSLIKEIPKTSNGKIARAQLRSS
jgi:acyl-CoA synthetase (AMP-forming)/AMP-acid ligase II